MLWSPNFSAATVSRCSGDGTKHVGAPFKSEKSKERKDEGFFVVNGLCIRNNDLVFVMLLDAIDKELVASTTSCNQHFAFWEMFG